MIKVIDTNTGIQLIPGIEFKNILGKIEVLEISNNPLNAYAKVLLNGTPKIWRSPLSLIFRILHPDFLLQPVWFVNS